MPLTDTREFATEKYGSQNREYCICCYEDASFTRDVDMEGMIGICAGFLDQYNADSDRQLTLEEAKEKMRENFPKLKRWNNG
ncbi:MAG: zinc ribbon domain-containing protein [Rikenellaceae bacterium]|nr:zinc ribbon domain-containing protein [Rikenellaceae bacterium]